ncbi:MAG: hypothetical protein M1817_006550 [Caeruleum heppii]|nr:MAG: hypothetical protein M1817_006550 [Caeruleum heppii]
MALLVSCSRGAVRNHAILGRTPFISSSQPQLSTWATQKLSCISIKCHGLAHLPIAQPRFLAVVPRWRSSLKSIPTTRGVARSFSTEKDNKSPYVLFSALSAQHPPSKPAHTPVKPRLLPTLLTQQHENIYTLPNFLTFSRLLSAPLIGYLIVHDAHLYAFSLFVYAGFTDLIDGWLARRWGSQTVVGSVVDPMADKTLMTVLTVCLAVKGILPVWLAVIILGRDMALGIAAIYYRYISLPPPKTLARYWDFSLPSAEVHPTQISKINTALQLGLIGACMGKPLISGMDVEGLMMGMQYLVATTTIWSGLSYVYTKDAVKILTSEEQEERIRAKQAERKPERKSPTG